MGPWQYYHSILVDLGIMVMTGYSTFPKLQDGASSSGGQVSVIPKTIVEKCSRGILPLQPTGHCVGFEAELILSVDCRKVYVIVLYIVMIAITTVIQIHIQIQADSVVSDTNSLLNSDSGPWRHDERDTMLTILCWPHPNVRRIL